MLNRIIYSGDAMESNTQPRLLVLRTLAHDNGEMEITAPDTGNGIPADDLERIFNFFVTTKADGIDLGLAICRTIVRATWRTHVATTSARLRMSAWKLTRTLHWRVTHGPSITGRAFRSGSAASSVSARLESMGSAYRPAGARDSQQLACIPGALKTR